MTYLLKYGGGGEVGVEGDASSAGIFRIILIGCGFESVFGFGRLHHD